MKYTHREIPEGINVASTNHLHEFLALSAGLVGILIATYLLLGLIAEQLVTHLSPSMELRLEKVFPDLWDRGNAESDPGLQAIVDRLAQKVESPRFPFRTRLLCSKEINAFAYPGGSILVLRGLVDSVKSENELAMVLAHEIGHFQNRDHLRSIGRGLVLMTAMALVGMEGSGGFADVLMSKSGEFVTLQFSQAQETEADRFGLELLYRTYGHAGGAVDFFKTLEKKRPEGLWAGWFATHPTSTSRVETLKDMIRQKRWSVKNPEALSKTFSSKPCK